MNKVIISGNITKDIDLRKTQTNKSVARFSVANNEGYGDKKITTFINCQAWEKTADLIANYCSKGSKVLIEGSWRTNSYEKDGKSLTDNYIVVNSIEFLSAQPKHTEERQKNVTIDPEELPFY